MKRRFLSPRRMREWSDVMKQLKSLVEEMGWRINTAPATFEEVHRALLTGLLGNIGSKAAESDSGSPRTSARADPLLDLARVDPCQEVGPLDLRRPDPWKRRSSTRDRRRHRTRVDRAGGGKSSEEELVGAPLGRSAAAKSSRWSAARSTASRSTKAAARASRPTIRPWRAALHPGGVGRGRDRHRRRVLQAQPADGGRDPRARTQDPPSGRVGRRRTDLRLLRRAAARRTSARRRRSRSG